jgi:hypothetical protein
MFNFSRWLRRAFCGSPRRSCRVALRRRIVRPQLEELENRVVLSASWTPVGPAPILNSVNTGGAPVSGRVTGIAADPGNANDVYLAAADGGVWKTTDAYDATPTWTPLTDNLTDC